MDPNWYQRAACLGEHELVDAAADGDFTSRRQLNAMCRCCPVIQDCFDDAVAHGDWRLPRAGLGKKHLHQAVRRGQHLALRG